MRVILYMATTIDGFIATKDDDTSFVTKTEWESFDAMTKKIGNLIIGRRTYDVSVADGTFPYADRFNVVVSHASPPKEWGPRVAFARSPKEALSILETQGVDTACVAGGGSVNGSFMAEG